MSTLAEQVEAEQEDFDAAEAGEDAEPEPEPEDLAEPEDVAEPEAVAIGPDELRKAERARDAYRKKMGDILGPEAVAHECLLCAGLGYLSELPPLGMEFAIGEGPEGLTLEFRAPRAEPPYASAPDKAQCEECEGWGQVLTGAVADHSRLASCSKCSGNGWVIVARPVPDGASPEDVRRALESVGHVTAGQLANDAWGRPAGHIHWGVPPANVQG